MDIEAGQEVVLTRTWPLRPGSNLSLQSGDRGRVLRSTPTHVLIETHGAVVVVAIDAVAISGSAQHGDAPSDEWFDRWATQMDKHRRRRQRPEEG